MRAAPIPFSHTRIPIQRRSTASHPLRATIFAHGADQERAGRAEIVEHRARPLVGTAGKTRMVACISPLSGNSS